jgi:hypothetical protein
LHPDGPTRELDALAQTDEAESLLAEVGDEPRPLVPDADRHDLVVLDDRHVHGRVARVLGRVGQALLHEPVDRDLDVGRVALALSSGLIGEVDLRGDMRLRESPRALDGRF